MTIKLEKPTHFVTQSFICNPGKRLASILQGVLFFFASFIPLTFARLSVKYFYWLVTLTTGQYVMSHTLSKYNSTAL